MDFAVSGLNYDAGSNILSMKQRGVKVGSNATIDSLSYTYFANSNQLQKVTDGINDNSPLGDFKDTSLTADDYVYDVNGNIIKDNNRHMHTTANGNGAVYNVLDKPDSMVIAGKATIYSYYDAVGARLRKQVNPVGGVSKNYLYINGFVYCNDTLQYVMQEEGRIRWAQKRNSTTGVIYYAFEYDYFLRDHLGNVRTVLTEGRDTSTYAATMESADSVVVRALFSNVYDPVNTVLAKPTGFDSDGANQKVSRLNASAGVNKKIGPSLVLKVMAGDKVQISTYAFYNTAVQPPPGGVDLTSEILTLLSSGVVNNSGGKITSTSAVSTAVNPGVTNFLNNGRPYDNQRPKAYLNWILFDNQFNYVASNSGVQQAVAGSSKQALIAPLQTISKNGYLYIYVSNESQQDVYFDDLNVKHYTGPLVQEQSYYPFGLQMAGISDKALNKLSSQYKFNGGVELEEDFGVNLYSTFFRQYDPQLGRFSGVDMRAEEQSAFSTYHFAASNPISFNDPFGDLTVGPGGERYRHDYSSHDAYYGRKNQEIETENFWDNVFDSFDQVNSGGAGVGFTHFFDMKGNALTTLPDGSSTLTLTFIWNEYVDRFWSSLSVQEKGHMREFGYIDYTIIVPELRKLGISYDLHEFLAWDAANNNDIYSGTDYKSTDGKGPLKAEHVAGLRGQQDGYIHILNNTTLSGRPDGFDKIPYPITIHNHVNEGRSYIGPNGPGVLEFGAAGMTTDINSEPSQYVGKGLFSIAVMSNTVYVYNHSGIFFIYRAPK